MPARLRPLPDDLGESFAVRDARGAGVSTRRLRHPALAAPFRGVRMRPAEPAPAPAHDESVFAVEARALTDEIRRRARAFAHVAPHGWFFSHVTAAVLWGLPVPRRLLRAAVRPIPRDGQHMPPRGIDVAAPGRRRASRAAGVRGHQLSPAQATVQTVDDLRVSSPASTWAMLAGELTVDELVVMGDAIVHIPRARGMRT